MKTVRSEMAGTVIEIKVKEGNTVKPGQELAVLESMKMEIPLISAVGGIISRILKNTGDFVNEGDVLFELS